MQIKGIFPPVTTPFINEKVAVEQLQDNIQKLLTTGISGVVVLGSNGESASLTRLEKLAVIENARKAIPEDRLLIAGTGSDALSDTIELTNTAFECGADVALVYNPFFYRDKMTPAALQAYFTKIADYSRIPILLYNVPKYTGFTIDAETVAKLAEHPNIVGIKSSSENLGHLGEIIRQVPADFSVLAGTGSVLFPALCLGAVGGVLALANVAGRECVQLQKYVENGDWEKARQLQLRLIPVNKAVTGTFGIAGLKAAMDMLSYFGGVPRLPLSQLSTDDSDRLNAILRTAGLT